ATRKYCNVFQQHVTGRRQGQGNAHHQRQQHCAQRLGQQPAQGMQDRPAMQVKPVQHAESPTSCPVLSTRRRGSYAANRLSSWVVTSTVTPAALKDLNRLAISPA